MMLENVRNNFKKICRITSSISKLDVRLIDKEENPIIQLVRQNLPAAIQNFEEDFRQINNILKERDKQFYYYYINSFRLQYIASSIWDNGDYKGAIIVGPFLTSVPGTELISDIITKNQIPISEIKPLQEFYESLSVVNNSFSSSIGEFLVNLCSNPFIDAQLITSDPIPSVHNKESIKTVIDESKNIIELRYEHEQKITNAIMIGDKEKLEQLKVDISDMYLENRIPESPIRSSKNLILVLNTLCRVAAKRGGVHPVYIHEISDKFAILIERAPNLPYLNKLIGVMVQEYCDLVKEYSTRQYSELVKKAVEYIRLNIDSPLTLQDIAESIHVNPSHLSRKFKQETGQNMTDFINLKRVEAAKLYLQIRQHTITDVAFIVGFNDVNYFSRVFKKITSLTPSQYMKLHKSEV